MSMPIRRTTARLAFTGAMALGSAGLLAGTAIAQQYAPEDMQVTVTTPGATIEIEGDGWDAGTTVTITRKSGNSAASGSSGGTEQVTATVREDGTFSAPIEVPEDAGGQEIQYEVSGVDEQGEERTALQALNVQLTSADMDAEGEEAQAAPTTPADDGGDMTGLALAAGAAVAVTGGTVVARRKAASKA